MEMEIMNPGQEQFLNFILERVDENQIEAVRDYMGQNFKKQQEGTFGMKDIEDTRAFLQDKVKPEYVGEVKAIMQQFAGNFAK